MITLTYAGATGYYETSSAWQTLRKSYYLSANGVYVYVASANYARFVGFTVQTLE